MTRRGIAAGVAAALVDAATGVVGASVGPPLRGMVLQAR